VRNTGKASAYRRLKSLADVFDGAGRPVLTHVPSLNQLTVLPVADLAGHFMKVDLLLTAILWTVTCVFRRFTQAVATICAVARVVAYPTRGDTAASVLDVQVD
jgi:hypothetical protein